jgi:hypothetical protein
MMQKLREYAKKESQMMMGKIHFWQEKMKTRVIQGFVPPRLVEQSQLEALEKVQLINITKNKALLLIREICERQLPGNVLHEDPE